MKTTIPAIEKVIAERSNSAEENINIRLFWAYKHSLEVDGYEAKWYDENDRFDFSSAEFDEIVFNAYKLGTLLKVSSEFLEDTPQDIENFIYEMIVERFSRSEEEAFFTGDGIGKPLGIIHQAQVGTVTENEVDINLDDIIELTYSVKKPYREMLFSLCQRKPVLV